MFRLGLARPRPAHSCSSCDCAGHRLRRRRVERAADFAPEPAAADRHARALSRCFEALRKASPRPPSTTVAFRLPSFLWGRVTCGAWFRRSFRSFWPCSLAYFILVHRSVFGRALYAIGFSPGGARYAGIPVGKRVGLVYLLSGIVSSLAAIIYVAHLGQARSDAGNGYELDAITAVVLGGTSVFGGRGTLGGTVLGLAALSILKNGLQLAALPSELTGVLTGVLLVDNRRRRGLRSLRPARGSATGSPQASGVARGEASRWRTNVKNSQVAVLCGAILVGVAHCRWNQCLARAIARRRPSWRLRRAR